MEKAKVRESNIELLRNISMFMILVIHANFVALPKIEYGELVSNSTPSITRFFIESLGIVAVNVFVFISGWFGIRTRFKSVSSFIYQILFFLFGGGIIFILLGKTTFNLSWVLDVLQLSSKDWFIKSYLLLMIIAPILNAYTRNTEERTQRYVMIAFFLFEAIFGWAMGGRRFFVDGYGPLHFIGLYITAQYVHNFSSSSTIPFLLKRLFSFNKWYDLLVFCCMAVFNTIFVVFASHYLGSTQGVRSLVYAYSNPIVIVGALYLLLFFSKLTVPFSKTINWFGAGSFAVYLVHTTPSFMQFCFTPHIQFLYEKYSGFTCVGMISLFLCGVYLVSVLIDQLRLRTWSFISNHIRSIK